MERGVKRKHDEDDHQFPFQKMPRDVQKYLLSFVFWKSNDETGLMFVCKDWVQWRLEIVQQCISDFFKTAPSHCHLRFIKGCGNVWAIREHDREQAVIGITNANTFNENVIRIFPYGLTAYSFEKYREQTKYLWKIPLDEFLTILVKDNMLITTFERGNDQVITLEKFFFRVERKLRRRISWNSAFSSGDLEICSNREFKKRILNGSPSLIRAFAYILFRET